MSRRRDHSLDVPGSRPRAFSFMLSTASETTVEVGLSERSVKETVVVFRFT